MKSRRICREAALQALYLCDALGDLSLETASVFSSHFLTRGFDDEGEDAPPREIHPFYQELVEGVLCNVEKIDKAIGLASTNWSVARMGLVERNIIRIAVYEIVHRSDVPPSVSINEAIEMAKEFASPEGPTFINGVLDRVAHQSGARLERKDG
ncbi:MAG: NusB: transcription antitermination factor [Pseudomonadota bacterium]|jgi:N utilization substance protein B